MSLKHIANLNTMLDTTLFLTHLNRMVWLSVGIELSSITNVVLSNLGLNRRFYVEIASIICYLINHSHCITIGKKTSIEIWFGSPIDYSKLRFFRVLFILTLMMVNWSLELSSAYFLLSTWC